jgi:hypothetical protein
LNPASALFSSRKVSNASLSRSFLGLPKFDVTLILPSAAAPPCQILSKGHRGTRSYRVDWPAGRTAEIATPVARSAQFTPDGKAIAYATNESGAENLCVQPLGGSAAHQITDFKPDSGRFENFLLVAGRKDTRRRALSPGIGRCSAARIEVVRIVGRDRSKTPAFAARACLSRQVEISLEQGGCRQASQRLQTENL